MVRIFLYWPSIVAKHTHNTMKLGILINKKILALIIVVAIIVVPSVGALKAFTSEPITGSFFTPYDLQLTKSGTLSSCPDGMREFPSAFGKSPVKVVFYALPPGCSVKDILVTNVTVEIMDKNVTSPLSFAREAANFGNSLHSTNSPLLYWEQGKMRKWSFVKLYYVPMLYTHNSLYICKHLNFSISYKKASSVSRAQLTDTAFDGIAKSLFSNYKEMLPLYTPFPKENGEKFDYLIITTKDVNNALTDFVSFKKNEGFSVKIVDVSDILTDTGGSGAINSSEIREFIKKHYAEWQVKYVLLVGDLRHIPMTYMYPEPNEKRDESGIKRPVGRTPTDFFYAELDSKLDSDGDGLPGEVDEDTKSMKDFYPDVFVGRVPFSDYAKVQSVLNNDIKYQTAKESFRKSVLLAGAMLYYGEEGTSRQDGGLALDFAWSNYLKPAGFTGFSMYEKAGTNASYFSCDTPLTENNFKTQIDSGKYGLILWNAHGSPTSIARKYWVDSNHNKKVDSGEIKWTTLLNMADIDSIKFSPSVTYSASCETAWPEKHNMGFETLLRGGAAFIGASRISYGGGTIDPLLEGFVQHYASDNFSLGCSLDLSLFEIPHSSQPDFVNLYDFNLYGDPSLRVNPFEYASFEMNLSTEKVAVETGHKADFSVSFELTKPDSLKLSYETDLAGVKVIFDKGEVTKNEQVNCMVEISPDMDPGNYVVDITATNSSGVKVSLPLHLYVILHKYEPYDLNKDGVINGKDLILFVRYMGTAKGESGFNPLCDFNDDGVINIKDLSIFSSHFGEKD